MLRRTVIAMAMLISACASSSGEGTTADWGANSFVNAADLGGGQWFITCTNAMSACTGRARQICPSGFDLVNTDASKAPVGAVTPQGGVLTVRTDYQLMVRCRA